VSRAAASVARVLTVLLSRVISEGHKIASSGACSLPELAEAGSDKSFLSKQIKRRDDLRQKLGRRKKEAIELSEDEQTFLEVLMRWL
jgi:hypothetical protein